MSLIFDSLKALESTTSSTPATLSSTRNSRFTKARVSTCVVGAFITAYLLWNWQTSGLATTATSVGTKTKVSTQLPSVHDTELDVSAVAQSSEADKVTTNAAQELPLQTESPLSAPTLKPQEAEISVAQVTALAESKAPRLAVSSVDAEMSDIDAQRPQNMADVMHVAQPQNADGRPQTVAANTPISVKPEVKIDLNVKAQAKQSLAQQFGDIRRAMQLQDWQTLSILLQEYDADLSATSPFITKAWAYMYMQQSNYQQAISYWQKAIYLVPTDEQSRMNLAVCQMQTKSYDEARAILEQGFNDIALQNRARDLLSRLRYLQSLQVSS